jgi:hypothetical protein
MTRNYNSLILKTIISAIVTVGVVALYYKCSSSHKSESADQTPPLEVAATEPEPTTEESDLPALPAKGEKYSNVRIPIYLHGNLRELFNDSNKYQYAYAQKLGITPIADLHSAYHTTRPIVHITSCKYYQVDSLTHSMPFLVPEAAKLLTTVGKNFIDSLRSRGRDGYRIKVTSLLRTPATVKKLRRVNVNATDSSTHQFGTTFDISYTKFHCLDSTRTINDGDLKNLLGEVLLDLRNSGKCMVKFERKTGCYHITAIQ